MWRRSDATGLLASWLLAAGAMQPAALVLVRQRDGPPALGPNLLCGVLVTITLARRRGLLGDAGR